MRVGFLFNHDQIHQIRHSLPIALALARSHNSIETVIAVSSDRIAAEVRRLAGELGAATVELVRLGLKSASSRAVGRALRGIAPIEKVLLYRDNLDFFRSLDALVVTERTSLMLKTQYGLAHLPMFLSDHGAGDRAVGFGEAARLFDHILAAGPKIRDRMVRDAGVDPSRISVTGYPKFDLGPAPAFDPPPGWAGRRTVLYNPHLSPHLSSWYRQGRAILEHFRRSPDYNLIVAPHVMLFHRKVVVSVDRPGIAFPGAIAARYRRAPNILIDTGSRRSVDMSYTQAADIYLGDASSQVYEFIRQPRPCVFVNPRGLAWRDDADFSHWRAGPVIAGAGGLAEALERSVADHAAVYAPIQRELVDYTFDMGAEPAAQRAARCIGALLAA
jgi:hypothetical protein